VKKTLTDRGIAALKPRGKRYEEYDRVTPGLAIRVTERGHKRFALITRFPGDQHPSRRSLGDVGAITLADAREKAREWLALGRALIRASRRRGSASKSSVPEAAPSLPWPRST
jgi:Arm DNA-binding domain